MAEESETSGLKWLGIRLGTVIAAALPIIVPAWMDIKGRIDDGKDEQRAHWKAERLHKDSLQAVQHTSDSALEAHRWDSAFSILRKKK